MIVKTIENRTIILTFKIHHDFLISNLIAKRTFKMLKYYYYILKKRITARQARVYFNTSLRSKKKRFNILKKVGIKVSDKATIVDHFYFEFGNIELLGDVFVNVNCSFLDNEKITIGDKTIIGPNVTITTICHSCKPAHRHTENKIAPVSIGENVWIGANSIILSGVSIGNNSIIAANSVVNADVPANVMFAGTPATFKRNII